MVSDKFKIRRALPGDFVLMATLAARAWKSAARRAVPPPDLSSTMLEAIAAKFRSEITQNADGALVAERDGAIVGWGARVPASNYISDLWVEPDHHRQGIGSKLIDALLASILLDGFTDALIGTHADNVGAIALYERVGFHTSKNRLEFSESFGRDVRKVQMRTNLTTD